MNIIKTERRLREPGGDVNISRKAHMHKFVSKKILLGCTQYTKYKSVPLGYESVQNLRDGHAAAEWQANMLENTQNIPKFTSHCYQRSTKCS